MAYSFYPFYLLTFYCDNFLYNFVLKSMQPLKAMFTFKKKIFLKILFERVSERDSTRERKRENQTAR